MFDSRQHFTVVTGAFTTIRAAPDTVLAGSSQLAAVPPKPDLQRYEAAQSEALQKFAALPISYLPVTSEATSGTSILIRKDKAHSMFQNTRQGKDGVSAP